MCNFSMNLLEFHGSGVAPVEVEMGVFKQYEKRLGRSIGGLFYKTKQFVESDGAVKCTWKQGIC